MPNSNTEPGPMQGSSPVVSLAPESGHAYARLRSFQDALDFAQRGFQHSLDRAERLTGVAAQLWREAADAYEIAYLAMQPLSSMPEDVAFWRAKEILHVANHRADEAAALGED